ncbi:MAG: redoxin family protein [Deltaproteobacteria bacterium]|nr:redoxin family protein [Deltaproteobacteria bacterium]
MFKNALAVVLSYALFTGCKSHTDPQPTQINTEKTDVGTVGDSVAKQDIATTAASGSKDASQISVSRASVPPATLITQKGVPLKLVGAPLAIGDSLPELNLTDAQTGEVFNTRSLVGKVVLISAVPAVNTPVCSAQSQALENSGDTLPPDIVRVTLSRDPILSLADFAQNQGNSHVLYLSDHEKGVFGMATGLGVDGADIIARAVIVMDRSGVVRHLQVVPEITQLPDMARAFQVARDLNTVSTFADGPI